MVPDDMTSRFSSLGRSWSDNAASSRFDRCGGSFSRWDCLFLGSVAWRSGCWQLFTVSRTWVVFQVGTVKLH